MYAKVALGLHIDELFDYLIPEHMVDICSAGSRVLVPFRKFQYIGYVVALSQSTRISRIRPILEVIDKKPILNEEFLRLTRAVADYYCCSWGEVIQAGLPAGIRRGLEVAAAAADVVVEKPLDKPDNFRVSLVKDYDLDIRLKFYSVQIAETVKEAKTVLVLVPEISLALRLEGFLKSTYCDKVAVTYRKLKPKDELALWERAKSGSISVLIGTRPVVFCPLPNLGLIIVDSEDAYGYKEEQSPYYHGRDVALMRAELERVPLILTSLTPSLESYYAAKGKKYVFSDSLGDNGDKVRVTLVDMKQYGFSKNRPKASISVVLEDRINKALSAGKKVIVFINRKGYASFAYCQKCGYIFTCPRCSSKLAYLSEEKKLLCNSCGFKKEQAVLCPQCNANYIKYAGLGIEKVVNQLNFLFPQAAIVRIDKEHAGPYDKAQVIVATEMIFHQDSRITGAIVAVIDLDSALNIINYRGNEKIYSLLYKLKGLTEEELLIQTSLAEYYSLKKIRDLNLERLYDDELKERKALNLPPFTHLASLNMRGKDQERVEKFALSVCEELKGANKKIPVFEPMESLPFKLRNNYRYSILLKAKSALELSKFIRKHLHGARVSGVILTVDIDPQ